MKWKHKRIVKERFLEFSFNNFSNQEKEYPRRWTLRFGLILYYSTLCPWNQSYIGPLEKLIQGCLRHSHISNTSGGSLYPAIFLYDKLPKCANVFWFNWPLSDWDIRLEPKYL